MPFLTSLDENAYVKGSRDPLGLVPVWSRFGRDVVGTQTLKLARRMREGCVDPSMWSRLTSSVGSVRSRLPSQTLRSKGNPWSYLPKAVTPETP